MTTITTDNQTANFDLSGRRPHSVSILATRDRMTGVRATDLLHLKYLRNLSILEKMTAGFASATRYRVDHENATNRHSDNNKWPTQLEARVKIFPNEVRIPPLQTILFQVADYPTSFSLPDLLLVEMTIKKLSKAAQGGLAAGGRLFRPSHFLLSNTCPVWA